MAKEKSSGAKGKKITLKMAKKALRVTPDGKTRLDLSNMGIATFPKCLLRLADLEELDLSRNWLKKIPDFIGQLRKVHWIDLHSNHIEKLPQTIGQLQTLHHLNLCNNYLDVTGLPAELGNLKNLQTLNLGMNRLTAVPASTASLTNLRELGLFDNKLAELPEYIRAMPNLQKLNARRNPATSPQENAYDAKETENLRLVKEEDLCEQCLEKCEKPRLKRKRIPDRSQSKRNFLGLIAPNSVAKCNEGVWRLASAVSPDAAQKRQA